MVGLQPHHQLDLLERLAYNYKGARAFGQRSQQVVAPMLRGQ
jgi:hypothetical protein